MVVTINGKKQMLDAGKSLEDLVESTGLARDRIVIEHNRNIVLKEMWQGTFLKDEDNIEIVSFVGGG